MLKALFALVTIVSPLVMLAAAVRVFRLPYRNKWLWVILSFLGLVRGGAGLVSASLVCAGLASASSARVRS